MKQILDELFYIERESGRLALSEDSEYQRDEQAFGECYDRLWELFDHKKSEELYTAVMAMLTSGSKAAFRHGLRLGLRLALWAEG